MYIPFSITYVVHLRLAGVPCKRRQPCLLDKSRYRNMIKQLHHCENCKSHAIRLLQKRCSGQSGPSNTLASPTKTLHIDPHFLLTHSSNDRDKSASCPSQLFPACHSNCQSAGRSQIRALPTNSPRAGTNHKCNRRKTWLPPLSASRWRRRYDHPPVPSTKPQK